MYVIPTITVCEKLMPGDRDHGSGVGRKGYKGDGGVATKALLNEPYGAVRQGGACTLWK